jgi:hypothetical protein
LRHHTLASGCSPADVSRVSASERPQARHAELPAGFEHPHEHRTTAPTAVSLTRAIVPSGWSTPKWKSSLEEG